MIRESHKWGGRKTKKANFTSRGVQTSYYRGGILNEGSMLAARIMFHVCSEF